ncbi:MAG: phenylalanine--tRNA ligase subunit alpha [Candidatus Omnitrophica bacterium]|nr:phenylalanine--tRNA ligase subunit alpha [Candidatus Omnitrophota bacterium]
MLNKTEELRADFEKALGEVKDQASLEGVRVRFLGRKGGFLTEILRGLKDLNPEERRLMGAAANQLKKEFEARMAEAEQGLQEKPKTTIDLTLPGPEIKIGRLHPLTQIIRESVGFFEKIGFQAWEGPEIETEWYNFDALNTPADHPARDMQDTFYLAPGVLLRSHTSPVQVRVMEKEKPPLRIITAGRCYRRDAQDASHSPVFHQLEGLMVEKGTNFTHLKGVLTMFLEHIFPFSFKTRFTPSFFPFTEPSAEVSISCPVCQAKGCSSCGRSGFLEILGCGMVHPNVLRNVGYKQKDLTGFAFGVGIERIAMVKYGIPDIRLFYENDVRFLRQF